MYNKTEKGKGAFGQVPMHGHTWSATPDGETDCPFAWEALSGGNAYLQVAQVFRMYGRVL